MLRSYKDCNWEIGNNVQIDTRWGGGDTELFRKYAGELRVALLFNPALELRLQRPGTSICT